MTTDAPALDVRDLTKSFGSVRAAQGISFTAHAGQITAVLGPNGAGKSTTLACATGLLTPDAGEVRVLGKSPDEARAEDRARVGVMLQDGGLTSGARARTLLEYGASMFAHPRSVDDLAATLEIDSFGRTLVRRLSGGQRQRLSLALALVGRPDILFLDEPTAGMDAAIRRRTRALIREEAQRGAAVVLTTHAIDDVDSLADKVVVIAGGRVLADGTTESVVAALSDHAERTVNLRARGAEAASLTSFVHGVRSLAREHGIDLAVTDGAGDLESILVSLTNAGVGGPQS